MAVPKGRYLPSNAHALPKQDNVYTLGSLVPIMPTSGGRWNNIHSEFLHGQTFSTKWADVAENFTSEYSLEEGDVVSIGGESQIILASIETGLSVLGVISKNPALLMNKNLAGASAVALMGRIYCKVTGPVKKGQRLVASEIPGVAMGASSKDGYYSIIGRALADKSTTNVDLCLMVIGVK